MTIIAFYPVSNDLGWDRDAPELACLDEDMRFKRLWENRHELDARIYSPESDPSKPIGTLSELEDDYNNEDYDGGWWMVTMEPNEEFVWEVVKNCS